MTSGELQPADERQLGRDDRAPQARDGQGGLESSARGTFRFMHALTRRWAGAASEIVGSCAAAALLTWSAIGIRVNPLERVGQVSGLAAIGLRFTVAVLILIGCLHAASRWRGGVAFDRTARVVCAALAGLLTGFVAAGVVVGLRGTPWCLNGHVGDAGRLSQWAAGTLVGKPVPSFYPPLPVHTIALYSRWLDLAPQFALKHLQIIGTAAMGPIVYASWRLVASPLWALGIGVLAALPLIDPYKPYANTALAVLLPVLVAFFSWVRRAEAVDYPRLIGVGVAFGAGVSLICLTYFGWFQWSAPGALVAALLVFPFSSKRAALRAACLMGSTGLVLAVVAGPFVWRILQAPFADHFFYFDTDIEPAYFAMWRWDLPGRVGEWPPPGELGGVGLFTLLLATGLAVAVALGRRHVLVTTVSCLLAGCWLMRFWFAQNMWETKLVQLYPRTSIELLYCSLVLCGYAAYLIAKRLGALPGAAAPERELPRQYSTPSVVLGAVCGLALVFGSSASAIADRYMPAREKPPSLGDLAFQAHRERH
jgi:galactan 5-O-arabinofuranosyltransferase